MLSRAKKTSNALLYIDWTLFFVGEFDLCIPSPHATMPPTSKQVPVTSQSRQVRRRPRSATHAQTRDHILSRQFRLPSSTEPVAECVLLCRWLFGLAVSKRAGIDQRRCSMSGQVSK